MEADQSFDEDDDDEEEEEEEDIKTSKKRPASSPAVKSQVCFQPVNSLGFIICQKRHNLNARVTSFQKKMKMEVDDDEDDDDLEDDDDEDDE